MNSFPAVWQALGRLYDSSVETKESIVQLRESVGGLRDSFGELRNSVEEVRGSIEEVRGSIEGLRDTAIAIRDSSARLLSAVQVQQQQVETHDRMLKQQARRLDRNEVTTQVILEDLRQLLEGLRQRGNGHPPQ